MDVVEAGRPDDAAPRGPRRGLVVGVAALLVLGGVGYLATRPENVAREGAPSASPSLTGAVPTTPVPVTLRPDPPDFTWDLAAVGEITGLTLAVTDSSTFTLIELDTGNVTRVAMPGDDDVTVDPVARVRDGWLAFSRPACGEVCPADLYLVRGGDAGLVVERAHTAMPDPDGRTVWVTTVTQGSDHRDPPWLQRLTFDGTRIGPPTMLKVSEEVLGVTPDGPLVGVPFEVGASVVDAESRNRRAVLPGHHVVAVRGATVATFYREALHVTDLRTGRSREIARPRGILDRGAFDPTGRYVAVSFQRGSAAVRVYDVPAAREVPIAGLTTPPVASAFRWSPDGQWLVLAHVTSDGSRLAVWRPGLEQPFTAPPAFPRDVYGMVVTTGR